MAAARLCWLRLLVCSALLVTGTNGQVDICAGKKKTSCTGGLRLVGGTCVNMKPFTINARGKLKDGETVCLKEVKSVIKGTWFYPKDKDICNLDECFCYCNKNNYFVTVFFPTVKSLPRKRNNQGILVARSGSKCWCHNRIKKVFRSANFPLSECGRSDTNAIVIFNGCSRSARAATYKNLYNCARFEPATRSQAVLATGGLPFGLGKGSATKECLKKQACYAPGTRLQRSKNMNAASQVECYCKCSKAKYFMAAWIGTKTSGRCKCFNSRVKGSKQPCGSGRQLRAKLVKARRNTQHVCCRALTEKTTKKKPPTKPKTQKPSSRSQAVQASGLPSLGGKSPKKKPGAPASRSTPVSADGLPPMGPPQSRSSPVGVSGLPLMGGPPAKTTPAPKKPTVGIADEPDFVVPDDVEHPTSITLFPPYEPDFWDIPTEPPPPTHVIDLYLPNEPQPPQEPPTDVWHIVDLIYLDYPPDIPQDVLFFDEPMYHNFLPPVIYDEPYPPYNPEEPDTVMVPPFPPHYWMLGDDWEPYMPDMTEFTPSSFNEPAVYYE